MKRTWFVGFSLGVLLLGLAVVKAQQPPMSHQRLEFDVSNLNGLLLHGEARGVEGLDYTAAVNVTVEGRRAMLHRMFIDRDHHVYFGYDLEAYRVEGSPQVHVRFLPLSSVASFRGIRLDDCRPREMALPAEQTVGIGAAFEVPLEVDADGGRVLRDKLTFGFAP